jgi:histone-lysine N-methyltransferase SETD3
VLEYWSQGGGGSHARYIQSLPGVAPGVPVPHLAMFFSDGELQATQAQGLATDAVSQRHWWRHFAGSALAALPGSGADPFGGQAVDEARLGWALAVATSRSFAIRRIGGHTMVPLVDMADHAAESNAEVSGPRRCAAMLGGWMGERRGGGATLPLPRCWHAATPACDWLAADGRAGLQVRANDDGSISLIANAGAAAGSAVLLKYGSHDNHDLLLSYGFLLPDNPHDRFALEFEAGWVLQVREEGALAGLAPPGPGGGGGGAAGHATPRRAAPHRARSARSQAGCCSAGGGGYPDVAMA